MTEFLIITGVLVIVIPVTVYLSVKLARFAWLKGEQRFRDIQKNGEVRDAGES